MQNKTQDYNAYKHDDMDLNNIFLCLPPFVKIDQTKNWGGGGSCRILCKKLAT